VLRGRVEIRDVYPATVLRSHREAVLFVRLFVVRLFVVRLFVVVCTVLCIIYRSIGLVRVASARR
jgi:hypothetical protein